MPFGFGTDVEGVVRSAAGCCDGVSEVFFGGFAVSRLLLLLVLLELVRLEELLLLFVEFEWELLLWPPRDVSLDGTAVAPAGIELSYSRLSFSIADFIFEFIVIPRVSAMVLRSLVISGIQ